MKLKFLELCNKINTPVFSHSFNHRDQGRAAAPYRLFVKSVLGCNPTMLPGICATNGGQA